MNCVIDRLAIKPIWFVNDGPCNESTNECTINCFTIDASTDDMLIDDFVMSGESNESMDQIQTLSDYLVDLFSRQNILCCCSPKGYKMQLLLRAIE